MPSDHRDDGPDGPDGPDAAGAAVIVGAGLAARWVVITLRAEGFDGPIIVIGDEAHPPYDRPPLSKAVLKGQADLPQLTLMTPAQLDDHRVRWLGGQAVTAIDREARQVTTAGGETIAYRWLFLACGGRARPLPGIDLHPRIATLRSYEDAMHLRERIGAARHVIVIGGGWIGLEVAATARQAGCEVTVLEAASRACVRTVPESISTWLEALHAGHGTRLRFGARVESVAADDTAVRVQLAGAEEVVGDLLLLGIGMIANDGLAREAGLATDNGVLTDASGRTDDPRVFAVGDVANALQADGQRRRVESWENAQRMGAAAARAALDKAPDPAHAGPPWFWSDQYEDNLQLLGLPEASHRVIERALPDKRQRILYFCDEARVRAVAAINGAREIKIARKWISQDRFPDLDRLADAGVDPNKLPVQARTGEQ